MDVIPRHHKRDIDKITFVSNKVIYVQYKDRNCSTHLRSDGTVVYQDDEVNQVLNRRDISYESEIINNTKLITLDSYQVLKYDK